MKIMKKMKKKLIIIILCFIEILWQEKISAEKTPCPISSADLLPQEKLKYFDNGDLQYEDIIYHKDQYWTDGVSTFACVCGINNNQFFINEKKPCIRKCCIEGKILKSTEQPECIETNLKKSGLYLSDDQYDKNNGKFINVSEHFQIVRNGICSGHQKLRLFPEQSIAEKWHIYKNGSIFALEEVRHQSKYCIDWAENSELLSVVICFGNQDVELEKKKDRSKFSAEEHLYPILILVSVPFLLATLIVYAIIPELKNLYGKTLMCYVGCLIAAYCFLFTERLVYHVDSLCAGIAFIIHFSFLASFFWLNVMCFDIWWTFGGFRSLQGSVKQRERKKFIIYSVYAWGCASFLTGICLIMDLVPGIPDYIIKPQFGVLKCWFTDRKAMAIYFHGPMGITIICNICLFISTALKIRQHKKDTAHQLKGMDSRRHDDNKQWFNLYLKLFIVMGINWSMEIISWIFTDKNKKQNLDYIWIIPDLANTLQGVVIFIIFVWKEKIRRLLLKRIGWENRSSQSRNSTRTHSSTSRTVISTTMMAPLHEKSVPQQKEKFLSTDESDCL